MAQLIREWVMSCDQCNGESRIDRSRTRPPLQNPNEHITAPEDAMQIDLVPELPPSGGYENIVTAMDVFSRYLFAYPTSNQDAKTIARVLINIMTKHAYLPTTFISDEGTAFMSQVIEEVTGVLDITLKHATTKHAQTIGLLEQAHASIKQALKIETGERRSLWQKYVNFAVLNYNTPYHTSMGCEPSRVFLRPRCLQYFGSKAGNSPTATAHSHFANCSRCSLSNRNDPSRCSQECNASVHQIQSLLRQKGQRFKAQRSILCIRPTAGSESSRE